MCAELSPHDDIARVVESYGRHVVVRTADGERRRARLFGRRLVTICGDRVRVRRDSEHDLLVIDVLPRATLFARTDNRGRAEPLAANLALLGVMLAPEPTCDFYIADRYLAGAALAGIEPAVVLNKIDLTGASIEPFATLAAEYRRAGYPVVEVSAHTRVGLDAARALIGVRTAMLVGQSGVGKSSLTNALVPASQRPTRELSMATGEGRHTTVSSVLFELPGGGELIDTPGVRDYAPAPVADADAQRGWPEILVRSPHCRFNDCLHLREPGCAVRDAVAAGEIAARRYESYRRFLNLIRSLLPAHERPR
jgi:ribosome biogenesis GTPase / thiamine phosphate phosphatase